MTYDQAAESFLENLTRRELSRHLIWLETQTGQAYKARNFDAWDKFMAMRARVERVLARKRNKG